MKRLTFQKKLKSLFIVSLSGTGVYALISFFKTDEKFYKNVVMPLVHLLEPEDSHKLAVLASKYHLIPKTRFQDPECLKVRLFGKEFQNPVGIAAGFDKDGEAIQGLQNLGFGFVEIGSVTPLPQPGNPKPRVFRLKEDGAVINRYGFNSQGHDQVLPRLGQVGGVVGVNLGKNKNSKDGIEDYVIGIKKFGHVADYLVINVSSPNTPGLRTMQHKNVLKELLKRALQARNSLNNKPPLLLKLAPDLTFDELQDVANVINQKDTKVDGLIISNTTIQRPQLLSNYVNEVGGLSGKPLKESSTRMIAQMYKFTNGEVPIIGVGGIFSGQDAYEKIKAGASVVQLYTALIYEGPPIVTKIKKELVELLQRDGYRSIQEAVGKNAK